MMGLVLAFLLFLVPSEGRTATYNFFLNNTKQGDASEAKPSLSVVDTKKTDVPATATSERSVVEAGPRLQRFRFGVGYGHLRNYTGEKAFPDPRRSKGAVMLQGSVAIWKELAISGFFGFPSKDEQKNFDFYQDAYPDDQARDRAMARDRSGDFWGIEARLTPVNADVFGRKDALTLSMLAGVTNAKTVSAYAHLVPHGGVSLGWQFLNNFSLVTTVRGKPGVNNFMLVDAGILAVL